MNNEKDVTDVREMDFLFYAILSGFFSSIGSLFGKWSRTADSWMTQIIHFSLMITFNTCGLTNFAKGLNLSSSTLKATLVTSATNYLSTAIIGTVLLGEETPFLWWCGTGLIICGLVIISYQQMKVAKKVVMPSVRLSRSERKRKTSELEISQHS